MTNRNIIRKLEVSDFRGLEGTRTLDFEGADVVLFLGLNGFGKTSLFDAIEWCFTGKLGRYEQYNEVGRRQDFSKEKEVLRNKYATNPNTFVKVELDNGKIFGRRVLVSGSESDYNNGSIITGCDFGVDTISKELIDQSLVNSYFSATHILSQETINHFVTSKKPEDRYQALAINFGTAIFSSFENNTQALFEIIRDKEKNIDYDIESKIETVKTLKMQVNSKNTEISSVLGEINFLTSKLRILGVDIPENKFELMDFMVVMEDGVYDQVSKIRSKISLAYTNIKESVAGLQWLNNNSQSWITANSKLSKIESEVSNDRKKMAKIDELKNFIRIQKYDISLIKAESEAKKVNKANFEMVLDGFAQFKDTYNKINVLEKEILNRNRAILTAKENKDKVENKINQLNHRISYLLESFAREEALLFDVNKSEKFLLEYRVKRNKILSDIDEFNKNVDCVNSEIVQCDGLLKSLEIVDEYQFVSDIFFDKKRNYLIQDEYLKNFEHTISKLKSVEKDVQKIVANEIKLQRKAEETRSCFSQTRQILSMALLQLDDSRESQGCPVCDTIHSTVNLKDRIERKLGSEENETLKLFEGELKEIQKTKLKLEAEVEEVKRKVEEIVIVIKTYLSETLQEKALQLSRLTNYLLISRKNLKDVDTKYDGIVSNFEKLFGTTAQDYSNMTTLISRSILEKNINIENNKKKAQILKQKMSDFQILLYNGRRLNNEALSDISFLKDTAYLSMLKNIENLGVNPVEDRVEINIRDKYNINEQDICSLLNKIKFKDAELKEAENKIKELLDGNTENEFRAEIIQKSEDISSLKNELGNHLKRLDKLNISPEDYTYFTIDQLTKSNSDQLALLEKQFETIDVLINSLEKIKEYNLERPSRDNILKNEHQIKILQEHKIALTQVKEKLNNLKKCYPKVLKVLIEQNLDIGLFNKIYELLNPHRRFKMIDFNVDINRNKIGINFNAKHSKVNGRPEFLFSSAQLNTFGICMFLSMALRQNWLDLNTILIDDPIQNLDDINVLSLIDFLRGLLDSDESDKKQIVLSTHDERFYDLMVRKFQNYNLKTFKYESYGKLVPDMFLEKSS